MAHAANPYGDGQACGRIADAIEYRFGLRAQPPAPFHRLTCCLTPRERSRPWTKKTA